MATRVFVGNLDLRSSADEIRRFLSRIDGAVDVRIPRDRYGGGHRGFAFVDFAADDDARRAFEKLDGSALKGRRLRLQWATESESRRVPDRRPAATITDAGGRPEPGPEELDDPFETPDRPAKRSQRPRRGGKHGSDRLRRSGARRYIE